MRDLITKLTSEGLDLLTIQQRTHVQLRVLMNPDEASERDVKRVLRLYNEVVGDVDDE